MGSNVVNITSVDAAQLLRLQEGPILPTVRYTPREPIYVTNPTLQEIVRFPVLGTKHVTLHLHGVPHGAQPYSIVWYRWYRLLDGGTPVLFAGGLFPTPYGAVDIERVITAKEISLWLAIPGFAVSGESSTPSRPADITYSVLVTP